ncbi:FAD-dependent oxidoreductase [Vibrio parahaemolyticus]|uniref:FAD-dependent oxidoreductase n=1 Tax=Vibrio parahaemolyticus TaxID=670 RepID=UPI00041575A3|nr:FAD-dependent oxidoreductase [Vibrio parahaemolyticus]APU76059.1 oxidoreductase [Vibrio parahaemolyticus]EGQ7765605.1 FAD-dependent oxidoreductase [Vibrio parahaemolyticus]EGQ7780041.1 FAD-dependent oxidoreductase [Vibrio parahaemolyticus]EGQ7898661.1 FAD-dependent oxidoreductase [Vibrio parahaemolyticus]EGQ8009151.1 FAD-dependent oxidoreductase [Vibrio parahaemolyticus]
MKSEFLSHKDKHIAVVGGGVAGATAAIHFAELGFKVSVIEKGVSLVNGPPICHLHAGGNLYREISEQQCLDLLTQSIDTIRLYPHSLNIRPTIIAVPHSDGGDPFALLPRLEVIKSAYQALVDKDEHNKVLGEPEEYFKLYSKEELQELAKQNQPEHPSTFDEWSIPFAQHADLEQLKYPVVAVQEYGWSVFRLAAIANLTLAKLPNSNVITQATLNQADWLGDHWQLTYEHNDVNCLLTCDYLVNACGFETGTIDNAVGAKRDRLVEFKAAYVTKWNECNQQWPEVIFHGPRGTDKGMAQLTPYGDGYFQLHGMTKEITLFEDGLVESTALSAQPELPVPLLSKIRSGWREEILGERTHNAIQHMAQFIPDYKTAEKGGKALFGAQQIPGTDPVLRAADVSFEQNHYARIEVVKASSTLLAAQKMLQYWFDITPQHNVEAQHPVTVNWSEDEIEQYAIKLTEERGYPHALAERYGM